MKKLIVMVLLAASGFASADGKYQSWWLATLKNGGRECVGDVRTVDKSFSDVKDMLGQDFLVFVPPTDVGGDVPKRYFNASWRHEPGRLPTNIYITSSLRDCEITRDVLMGKDWRR